MLGSYNKCQQKFLVKIDLMRFGKRRNEKKIIFFLQFNRFPTGLQLLVTQNSPPTSTHDLHSPVKNPTSDKITPLFVPSVKVNRTSPSPPHFVHWNFDPKSAHQNILPLKFWREKFLHANDAKYSTGVCCHPLRTTSVPPQEHVLCLLFRRRKIVFYTTYTLYVRT